MGAAPDSSAQLVQLRKAETLGVFDDHQAGVGHIDADFDHCRGDQDICFAGSKSGHHCLLFVSLHAAMDKSYGQRR
jgi:hypothetical protein